METVTMYRCETCRRLSGYKSLIYSCICCGKEICDECVFDYKHCQSCASGKTMAQMKQAFCEQYNK